MKGSQAVGQEPPGRPHAARGQQSHADPPAPPQLPRRPSPNVPQTTECWGTATAPPTRHSCGTKTGPDLQTGPCQCACARYEPVVKGGCRRRDGEERWLPLSSDSRPGAVLGACMITTPLGNSQRHDPHLGYKENEARAESLDPHGLRLTSCLPGRLSGLGSEAPRTLADTGLQGPACWESARG